MASLSRIWDLTSDNDGIVYASNQGNNIITKLDKSGKVSDLIKLEKVPYGLSYNKAFNILYVAQGDSITILDLNDLAQSQKDIDLITDDTEVRALAFNEVNNCLYYSCKNVDGNNNPLYYIKYLILTEDGKNSSQFSYQSPVNFIYDYMTYNNNNLYLTSSAGIAASNNYIYVADLTGYGSNSSIYVGNHINQGLQFDNSGNLYVNYYVSGDQYQNGVYKIDVKKNITIMLIVIKTIDKSSS